MRENMQMKIIYAVLCIDDLTKMQQRRQRKNEKKQEKNEY